MDRARIHEGIRRMRFEALLERQEEGALSQAEAAEMLGIGERTLYRKLQEYHILDMPETVDLSLTGATPDVRTMVSE